MDAAISQLGTAGRANCVNHTRYGLFPDSVKTLAAPPIKSGKSLDLVDKIYSYQDNLWPRPAYSVRRLCHNVGVWLVLNLGWLRTTGG